MTALPQLRPTALRDQVGRELRQALSNRRFEPGQSISEVGLAAEMGISRGPVREALLVLVQEGLVTHSPNRGFSVVSFTKDDIAEIGGVRLPLETLALTLAQSRMTLRDFRDLDRLAVQMAASYSNRDYVACAGQDMEFHSLIWSRSGNNRLFSTLQTLLAPFFAYGALFSAQRPDLTPELLHEEHACFIRFLRNKESRTADQCVRFHLGV